METLKAAKEAAKGMVVDIATREQEDSEKGVARSLSLPEHQAVINKQVHDNLKEEREKLVAEGEKTTERLVEEAAAAGLTTTNEMVEMLAEVEGWVLREAADAVTAVAAANTSESWEQAFKSLEDKAINIVLIHAHAVDGCKALREAKEAWVAELEAKLPPEVVPPAKDVAQKMVEAATALVRWRLMSNEPSGTMMRPARAVAIKAIMHLNLLEWTWQKLKLAEIVLNKVTDARWRGWNRGI